MSPAMTYVGRSVKRSEDPPLLCGEARFVADVRLPAMLHAAVLRSSAAHARITKLDTSEARCHPGVVAVLAAEDTGEMPLIPMRLAPRGNLVRALQRPLALEKVRYVGEPLAVVVAESRYEAEDALELIEVEYEPLDALVAAEAAIEPDAPILHEAVADNVADRLLVTSGDCEQAFVEADLVIEEKLYVQRHSGVPLETRGLLADYQRDSRILTVWGPTKVVHFNRSVLAQMLGIAESRIRFVEPSVGGGFGIRGEFYPEDYLIPFLAMRLGRPVSWIEDRSEHLQSANHSREQLHAVKLAATREGRILALKDRVLVNMGAYIRTHGATVPTMTLAYLPGPYRIPNYEVEALCVLSNKTPTGTYRGPGRFEAAFVRERLMDIVAHRLGLDPAEVRRRNFVSPDDMPYTTGTVAFGGHPVTYDSGDYPGQFEQALARFGYSTLRSWCEEERRKGRSVGIGIACFVEKSGLGPWEYGRVEVELSGDVVVYTGAADVGQGLATVLGQIVADEASVPFERVRVVHGDTAVVPYGIGSFASRASVMAGNAALLGARRVKEKLLRLAARALEVSEDDLVVEDGRVEVRGDPRSSLSFAEIAQLATPDQTLPLGLHPGLSEEAFFEAPEMNYPYGVHLVVAEVDRETGKVEILKYLVAYDPGRSINPMLVEGQIVGGVAQGQGGAMLEEFVYASDGQPRSTSFVDYLLPTALDVPQVDVLITEEAPSPLNPLGIKGAGEGGTVGVGAALAGAVVEALDARVECTRLPLSPENVYELALAAKGERPAEVTMP